jgi:hypothetical protein
VKEEKNERKQEEKFLCPPQSFFSLLFFAFSLSFGFVI